jgi:hypothetical protein
MKLPAASGRGIKNINKFTHKPITHNQSGGVIMETYAGIDLHSSNNYIGIMDQDHKRLFGRRLPNSLDKILMVLEPFKSDLRGVVVESTYN